MEETINASRARRLLPEGVDYFPLLLVAGALLKAVLVRRSVLGSSGLGETAWTEGAAIVLFLGGAYLVSRRSRPVMLGAYGLLSVFMLANIVYVSEFARPMDITILRVAGHAGQVSDSITSLLKPVYLLFVLDMPFIIRWLVRNRGAERPTPRSAFRPLVIAAFVGASLLLLIQIISVIALPEDTNPIAVIEQRGFGAMQIGSLLRAIGRDDPGAKAAASKGTTGREVQSRIEKIRHAEDGTRTADFAPGTFAGRNVIVIQVETLQSMLIGARLDGQEVAPNLTRLAEESWYFPNTFSQAGAGVTADAEFIANSGLYSPVAGFASVEYADREIPALPRLLGGKGYESVTLHQNYAWFWNRAQLYPALGFSRYYEHDFFGDRDKMWHASDQVLFEEGMKVVSELDAAESPFYAQFITMTSHSPYRYPQTSRRPVKLPERWRKSSAANWASAISYTDQAVGEFIEDLKRSGIYDQSVIVVYGDHSGFQRSEISRADKDVVRELTGRPYSMVDRQRIPLIVHLPGQSKQRRDEGVLGTSDIMPTLADLLGIDLAGVPHLGRSAFVASNAFVPMRAFVPPATLMNDRVMLVPGLTFKEAVAYSISDGKQVQPTEADEIDLERQSKLNDISDTWIRSLPRRPDAPEKMDRGFK